MSFDQQIKKKKLVQTHRPLNDESLGCSYEQTEHKI